MIGKKIISKEYSVNDFIFWNNDTIYFVANRENPYIWSLYKYNLTTKDLKKIADNISYNQTMRKIGDNLLFLQIVNNSTIPVLYNPETNEQKQFPSLTANPVSQAVTTKPISFGNLTGVIVKPNNFSLAKRYPLIIWLHGGPYRQAALTYHSYMSYAVYDWMLNEVASRGAIVLKLDYRGSYGHGRKFAESISHNVGKGDVEDVVKARTFMVGQYKITKTYLTGNSYGGYLSLRAIVEKPTLFAGSMSINGVTDWQMLLDKLQTSIFNVQFGGLLDEKNSNDFYQSTIVDRIKNLKNQRIVLAQASSDKTVDPNQADWLYKKLSDQKKNVTVIKYPGEDHIFKQKKSMINLCQNLFSLVGLDQTGYCNYDR